LADQVRDPTGLQHSVSSGTGSCFPPTLPNLLGVMQIRPLVLSNYGITVPIGRELKDCTGHKYSSSLVQSLDTLTFRTLQSYQPQCQTNHPRQIAEQYSLSKILLRCAFASMAPLCGSSAASLERLNASGILSPALIMKSYITHHQAP